MPLVLRPDARIDLAEAVQWYNRQRPGLGDDLILSVEASLAAIRRFPRSFPQVQKGIRRALTKRFPYAIYYRIEPAEVIVFGIFHAKRDPSAWQRRAGQGQR